MVRGKQTGSATSQQLDQFSLGVNSLTFNCACEISQRPDFQYLVRQTVAGYRLAAPSYWRPEEPNECGGGLFIQPRLQFIEIAHHDLLRRRFGVEFFRVDLKAL